MFFLSVMSHFDLLLNTSPMPLFSSFMLNAILSFERAFCVSFVICIGAELLYTGFSSFISHIPSGSGFSMFSLTHNLLIASVLYV